MRRVSRLANRYGIYYLRYSIPRGCHAIFKSREINRSLKTTHRVTAVERLLALSLRIDLFFRELIKLIPLFESLPEPILDALRGEITETIDTWPWVNVNHEEEIDTYLEHFTAWRCEIEDKQHNRQACLEEGAAFLQKKGLLQRFGDEVTEDQLVRIGYICFRISIFRWNFAATRLNGGYGSKIEDPDLRALMQANGGKSVLQARQAIVAPVQKAGTSLNDLFKRYRLENAHTMRGNRAYDFEQAFGLLADTLGSEVTAEELDKAHIRKVKDVMAHLPINARKNNEFKELTYPQIAEKNKTLGLKTISDRSRNRLLGCLNQLMDWARDQGFVQQNPVSGMLLRLPKEKSDRLPFDKDDLKRIFTAPTYVGMHSERFWKKPGTLVVRDSNYWMPILALCTGARANELLQLTKSDVRQEDGVWIIDINKRVKTRDSVRKVPLHPELISVGFVEWVTSLKIMPDERLFSEVSPASGDGKFSTTYSKRFGRFLSSLELEDERKVFHSFRHLFTDLLRAKADDGVIKAILGHDDPSVTSRYGKGYPLQRLHEAVSAVVLPVDLSHLHSKRMKAAS